MTDQLSDSELANSLQTMDGWSQAEDRKAITKSFVFANFVEAFGFMTRAAIVADKMNHHPEWFNVYKTVDVVLTTHSAGGVTELDIRLAQNMDRLASA